MSGDFAPFAERMRAEGLPDSAIRTFAYYYQQATEGATGLIPESDLLPVEELPDAEALPASLAKQGKAAFSQTVLLKLNGGLGTSMGLEKAKALLEVKNGLTFLDVIARQALHTGVRLLLMNSFNTRDDSLALLAAYLGLSAGLPLDFLQHKAPKVRQEDFAPVTWPQDPDLEWAPPGHGDIFSALVTSGMLDALLDHGYRYAFISNADNLGAVIDPLILGYFIAKRLPFLMEAADRTFADTKGGHLARLLDGRLILRESAQCSPEDEAAFQDITRHRYFNTNNLWLSLPALKERLEANDGVLRLPMIRNAKTVDPRDPDSTPVYQLETAMGSAISEFDGAGAIRVPRTRFAPVKTTGDLLAVRSNAYAITEDYRVILDPARGLAPPLVSLDQEYYRLIDQLEERFPHGAPSLLACKRLNVIGDFRFGRDVVLRGDVRLVNETSAQLAVHDGAIIDGAIIDGVIGS